MKRLFFVLSLLICIISSHYYVDALAQTDFYTPEEQQWLEAHREEIFYIGLDPFTGMEYFQTDDGAKGYLEEIAAFISEKTELKLALRPELTWGEAVVALENESIQVLFGANPTPERMKTMSFTEPIYSVPYTVLSLGKGAVRNIGDLNHKRVGFLEEDIIIEIMDTAYTNLSYEVVTFADQEMGLIALNTGIVDAFVTSGGDVTYDYLFRYPELEIVANLEDIRSLMTFSALKHNEMLISILQKNLDAYNQEIQMLINDGRVEYVRNILNLSAFEKQWLKMNPSIKVGVPTDYLPIDYFDADAYKGIAGHYMTTFANLVGIEVEAIPGSFDEVFAMLESGEIDVLNMAITDERLKSFTFTDAFSNERDQIYGLRDSKYVHDVYGLDGKRVAVINGFWHIDHLILNLQNPNLVYVSDIKEAIEAVVRGEADYFIETPAVAEYYISGLGYTNIIKKGETSADSYLYFGMLQKHKPLADIFNRTKTFISYENSKHLGVQGLPEIENVANRRLFNVTIAISGVVIVLILISLKLQRDLILTKEKERLLYIDPLTGIHNRNYFNLIESDIDNKTFPQALLVLDIKHLKRVNDRFGHLNGDRLIEYVSNIISEVAKADSGLSFRMGGDEFVLMFFGKSEDEIIRIVNTLKNRFNTTRLYDKNESILILDSIEVAVGYNTRLSREEPFELCLQEADAMMYADKANMKK